LGSGHSAVVGEAHSYPARQPQRWPTDRWPARMAAVHNDGPRDFVDVGA